MNPTFVANKEGVTLIELLVGLVISAAIIAGVYRVFTTQTRAYSIQGQVVDVQQNIRSVMELILRDIRVAAFHSNINPVTLVAPIFPGDYSMTAKNDAIRLEYQRRADCSGNPTANPLKHAVVYYRDADGVLQRALYVSDALCANNPEALLADVTLNFRYEVDGTVGLDSTQNGASDDLNGDGIIDDADRVLSGTVTAGNLNIIAVRVELTTVTENPDIGPIDRNLASTVNLRNLCLIKSSK